MLESRDLLIITNNNRVLEKYQSIHTIEFHDETYLEVLVAVRNKIHQNYKLLIHPMAGSLKPNQTPFKSVILMETELTDYNSLMLIENAIESANKFLKFKSLPKWSENCIYDFKTLDLSFVEGAITNKSLNPCYQVI